MVILSIDYFGAFKVVGIIVVISVVFAILVFWLSNKFTKGRGVAYKFIQDYGYDDARTMDAIKTCACKILTYEGYGKATGFSIFHEVGNKYTGSFQLDDIQHNFILRTDGWHFDYQIDDGPVRTWKGK